MARTWIFQGNPDVFDFDGYLAATREIVWSVRQTHLAPIMAIGDDVYLWRAGGQKKRESGIVAFAKIADTPSVRPDDEASRPFWKDGHVSIEEMRIALRVTRIANKVEMIDRGWLKHDPILMDLPIMKMSQGTNYPVGKQHESRLKSMWARTGADWTREESIAGLWTYVQHENTSLSDSPNSLVAKTAVLIGRAVSGMYNKVQNFIALDPRNERSGFSRYGKTDKMVWNEFYDPATKTIRKEQLEHEFQVLWGGLHEPSLEPIQEDASSGPAEQKTPAVRGKKIRASGQGYNRDPRVNRVIELRAVELAKKYYEERFEKVLDTGDTESFDLACFSGTIEMRRVEVKGTTTTGATIILTRTEVEHARSKLLPVDLVVVRNIEVLRSPDGPQAVGGEFSVISDWTPAEEHLTVSTYNYKPPI